MSYKQPMGSRGGMPWILAQTVIYQLNTLDSTLLARINHLALIYSEVKAIVDAQEPLKVDKQDYSKLQEVACNLDSLRDSYEPLMDDPLEGKNVADIKRKTSEKLLDISRYNLLYIIEKYKLVDVKTLQEVTGMVWGGE